MTLELLRRLDNDYYDRAELSSPACTQYNADYTFSFVTNTTIAWQTRSLFLITLVIIARTCTGSQDRTLLRVINPANRHAENVDQQFGRDAILRLPVECVEPYIGTQAAKLPHVSHFQQSMAQMN